MAAARDHPSVQRLLDWWLHDADAATADEVDAHLMRCDACGHVLDELVALGEGVRSAFRAGSVATVASGAFVRRLSRQGLAVRTYRVPCNGSVACTVAPGDDVVVSILEAPLDGVERIDAVAEASLEPGARHRLGDVPFDRGAGEVICLPRLDRLKRMPAHTFVLTLLAVTRAETRELGRYTFDHRPWPGPAPVTARGPVR